MNKFNKFLKKIGIHIGSNNVYSNIISNNNMVSVNGKQYKGNSLTIINDVVYVDGKRVDCDDNNTKTINITVDADVETIKVDNCYKFQMKGNCNSVSSTNGDISITGEVSGDVTNKNGNIRCGNVGGDATNKNGNIRHR